LMKERMEEKEENRGKVVIVVVVVVVVGLSTWHMVDLVDVSM